MKTVSAIFTIVLIMGNAYAQSNHSFNGAGETKRVINNKKFRLLYDEIAIDASVEDVWKEVAGNFTKSDRIAASINASNCLSGDLESGLGAERFLSINFQGSTLEVKERIIDFQDCGDHREFTYDVYESKGSPLNVKTYNTWSVRKGEDGKTYLGNLFIFRANFNLLTGVVGKKLAQSGSIRTGLLTYKHFFETGEKRVSEDTLNKRYPR